MLPNDGNVALEMPELGGRKLGVPDPQDAVVGPRCLGDLEDMEAVRKDRNWPRLGM